MAEGIPLWEGISLISNSFVVGESLAWIFKALRIVTNSLCNLRGISPLSLNTEELGEDLKAVADWPGCQLAQWQVGP